MLNSNCVITIIPKTKCSHYIKTLSFYLENLFHHLLTHLWAKVTTSYIVTSIKYCLSHMGSREYSFAFKLSQENLNAMIPSMNCRLFLSSTNVGYLNFNYQTFGLNSGCVKSQVNLYSINLTLSLLHCMVNSIGSFT